MVALPDAAIVETVWKNEFGGLSAETETATSFFLCWLGAPGSITYRASSSSPTQKGQLVLTDGLPATPIDSNSRG